MFTAKIFNSTKFTMMGKRELLARTLEWTGLGKLLSRTVGNWNGLLVFNYHRIGDYSTAQFDRALYSADQHELEQQIRFLKKNADLVRVADLSDALRKPSRAVMLTFDDGYRDNFEFAFPVLKQQQAPATFFITSGFIDGGVVAWWDEIAWMVRNSPRSELSSFTRDGGILSLQTTPEKEQAIVQLLSWYKKLPDQETTAFLDKLAEISGSGRCPAALAREVWMEWDMIREMDRSGMDIGGHTVTHPILSRADLATQQAEILGSKQRIEAELGHRINAFSYPVGVKGTFTTETKRLLKDAGYDWAFSFSGGFSSVGHLDEFDLPRVAVSPTNSRDLFQSTARLPWLFA